AALARDRGGAKLPLDVVEGVAPGDGERARDVETLTLDRPVLRPFARCPALLHRRTRQALLTLGDLLRLLGSHDFVLRSSKSSPKGRRRARHDAVLPWQAFAHQAGPTRDGVSLAKPVKMSRCVASPVRNVLRTLVVSNEPTDVRTEGRAARRRLGYSMGCITPEST